MTDEDLPDDFGIVGKAAAHIDPHGDRTPAVIKGSRREPEENARVLLSIEGEDQLLDTDRSRVEVLA